jgi:ribosome-binding protein aMBF1 (putative translation factor)
VKRATCCVLGEVGTPAFTTPPTRAYTDALGYTYALCEVHYRSLVTGLLKAEHSRAVRRQEGRIAPWEQRPPPLRKRPRRTKDGPAATPDEQRTARELVGWSIRRLAREFGLSYQQVQGAERGKRPVDQEIASWVRRILSAEDSSLADGDRAPAREAGGDGRP